MLVARGAGRKDHRRRIRAGRGYALLDALEPRVLLTGTVTYTLVIGQNNGASTGQPGVWTLFADVSAGDNFGLAAYLVGLTNVLTVTNDGPRATYSDSGGIQSNVTAGFDFFRSAANVADLTGAMNTPGSDLYVVQGFGQTAGDLTVLPGGYDTLSAVVQGSYQGHLKLAHGTYDVAGLLPTINPAANLTGANVLVSNISGVGNPSTDSGTIQTAVTNTVAPRADLTAALGATAFPGTTIVSGDGTKLTIPLFIGNGGNAAVPALTPTTDIQVFAHNTSTGTDTLVTTVAAQAVGGLAVGATKGVNVAVTLPSTLGSGIYTFKTVVNGTNAVAEYVTTNNSVTTTQSVTVTQGQENLGGSLVSSTIPLNILSGPLPVKGSVAVLVKNLGNLKLPAGQQVTIQIVAHNTVTDAETVIGDIGASSVSALAVNGSKTFKAMVNYLPGLAAGSYQIHAVVTPVQALAETDTADNTLTTTVAAGTLGFTAVDPDISATLGSSTLAAETVSTSAIQYGGMVNVVVTNSGTIALPSGQNVMIQIIAHDGTVGDVVLTTSAAKSISGLKPGLTKTLAVPVKFFGNLLAEDTTFTLEAHVTPVQALTETGTANNLATVNGVGGSITLESKKAFNNLNGTIAGSTIAVNLAAGAKVTGAFSVTVQNAGNIPLPAGQTMQLQVIAHDSSQGTNELLGVAVFSVSGWKPGKTGTFKVMVSFGAGLTAGTYGIRGVITAPALVESESADNTVTQLIGGGMVALMVS